MRRDEVRAAVGRLAPGARSQLLGLPDGRLAEHEEDARRALVELVGDGRRTLAGRAVAPRRAPRPRGRRPGRRDRGRPHRCQAAGVPDLVLALGRAPTTHRGTASGPSPSTTRRRRQGRAPWPPTAARSSRCPTSPATRCCWAPTCCDTSPAPRRSTSPSTDGRRARRPARRATRPVGHRLALVREPQARAAARRAAPRAGSATALEVGSSTGALAADLAAALRRPAGRRRQPARGRRGADAAGATRRRAGRTRPRYPHEWPGRPRSGFDLVVLSEVGYFLSPRELDGAGRADPRRASPPTACWCCATGATRSTGWPLDGPAVHAGRRGAGYVRSWRATSTATSSCSCSPHPSELPDPRASA